MSQTSARSLGAAQDNRHDQASGTLITRPSTRSAMISSVVTRTLLMRGSLLAAVFIPSLYNHSQMRLNDSSNNLQLPGVEAMVPSQSERIEPELAGLVLAL